MALAEPDFIARDPAEITAEIIAQYEEQAGKKLYPAQIERLFIDQIAWRETLLRIAVQEAAKQNLVAYATAPALDYLGELVGVHRLPAHPAQTTLRFSVNSAQSINCLIPLGTRACATDSMIFLTDADVVLPAGKLAVDVTATCILDGESGNHWQPAQISTLLDDIGEVDFSVVNSTESTGGSDEESDVQLRERITLAPESFSNAGSYGAYRFHTYSVHPSIVDVAVKGPSEGLEPGCVEVYPLVKDGMPSPELLAEVAMKVNAEKIRPLTDSVSVKSPTQVEYAITALLTLYTSADRETTLAQAKQAAEEYASAIRSKLGNDIVPHQLVRVLQVSGVYNVELVSPVDNVNRILAAHEWANCTAIDLSVTGVENG
ncbi:baseplate protein [Obesumbacterium proteus]|uniref:baseplate assembly protein n=1 Tax=Obesumbacterium proteus TaxID=82983 RepID=UPI00062258A6|nr:baseplate J/gp47 family protein [Obesumbacterium proteus]KKI46745.1 baseplate protein [Obesumbacterium proteus]